MQLIYAVEMDPEQYVAERFHMRMLAPKKCPHCRRAETLWALGYYCRNLSRIGLGALLILVRRFRCRYCLQTVSLLPSFAQPYRFIQNRTIELYSFGQPFPNEVIRHLDILSRYWKRFCLWLPEIERTLGHAQERAPPIDQLKAWRFLLAAHGNLAATTQNLVAAFQITPFGRYRCHRPNGPKEAMVGKR
jgi:glutaredoxin